MPLVQDRPVNHSDVGRTPHDAGDGLAELCTSAPLLDTFSEGGAISCSGAHYLPVVVVLGGISANRFVCPGRGGGWWAGMVGEDCAVDPNRHCVIGYDFASDPSGLRAPSSHQQAQLLHRALQLHGIQRVDAIVGASYGGMVALAFADLYPEAVGRLAILSAAAAPHPASTAQRELQRRIVQLGIANGCADEALAIARGMAMTTYRTRDEFAERFKGGIAGDHCLECSDVGRYLHKRGEAFLDVMSPQRFLSLSASIDRHRVEPHAIHTPMLLIGADSDQLVPPEQLIALAEGSSGPTDLHILPCREGHDMFLTRAAELSPIVRASLEPRI